MKRSVCLILFFSVLSIGMFSCKGSKKNSSPEVDIPDSVIADKIINNEEMPLAIIYKTHIDLYDYVPVIMNEEKTRIVSYPAPSDLLSKPVKLKDNYLLDNRGINKNVAFLKYTYEEYSQLQETPSVEELMKQIKEKDPLKELINCGSRRKYNNEPEEFNKLIDAGFPGCERIELK